MLSLALAEVEEPTEVLGMLVVIPELQVKIVCSALLLQKVVVVVVQKVTGVTYQI